MNKQKNTSPSLDLWSGRVTAEAEGFLKEMTQYKYALSWFQN